MTTQTDSLTGSSPVRAKPSGFGSDLVTVAGRAIRSIPREPESFIPALFIPTFFFIVNIGALQALFEEQLSAAVGDDFNYRAFQLPTAIIFAVTGISRAPSLVTDISTGYFDRLLLTPTRRLPLLLGLMVADLVLVMLLCIPVIILGFAFGVSFGTGPLGLLVFILIGGLWGLAYTGFPYAIALKTGNAAAVSSSFLLFFPFAFLTSSNVPRDLLTGWLGAIATYNPLTYILEGMRSLVQDDSWDLGKLFKAFVAIVVVAIISQTLALLALKGRLKRG